MALKSMLQIILIPCLVYKAWTQNACEENGDIGAFNSWLPQMKPETWTCPMDTGGTCSFFGCYSSRNAVCSADYKCMCKPGCTCAKNGECVDVTGENSNEICDKAYLDRCFASAPYYEFSAKSCCGDCNQGEAQYTCKWRFEESQPCSNAFDIHGEFTYKSTDTLCQKACDSFNDGSLHRKDFCSSRNTAVTRAVEHCDAAVKAAQQICEWTPQAASSSVSVTWKHTRGALTGDNCNDYKKVDDSIQGDFQYKVEEQNGACGKAAEALGERTRFSAAFCKGGAVEAAVRSCPAAASSLKDSHVPSSWCQDGESVSAAPSPSQVHDAYDCSKAYKAGCWNKGAFKNCCGQCIKDTGYSKCHWKFTGPAEYDGNTCTSVGQAVEGEFTVSSMSCYSACNKLRKEIKDTSDLCAVRAELASTCKDAFDSVNGALGDTKWCPGALSALELPAVSLAEEDDLCQEAFDNRCFEKGEFANCCNTCSDGSLDHTCHWTFKDPTVEWHGEFHGLGPSGEDFCIQFNVDTNTRCDYCPGGSLYNRVEIYDPAKHSLTISVDKKTCDNCNCKPQANAEVECKWTHTVGYETGGSYCKDSSRTHDTKTNSFKYIQNNACSDACDALGHMTISPAEFCSSNFQGKMEVISRCPAAAESVKSLIPTDWCQQKNTPPDNAHQVAALDGDTTCADAFRAGCWNTGAFQECCGDCNKDSGVATCHWEFKGHCDPISGEFTIDRDPQCFRACQVLAGEMQEKSDFCPDSKKMAEVNRCFAAQTNVDKVVPKDWCNTPPAPPPPPSNAADAAATCNWVFTEGGTVESRGTFDIGQDYYCFAACNVLKNLKEVTDFCSTSESRTKVNRCPAAHRSVLQATKDKHYCKDEAVAFAANLSLAASTNLDSLRLCTAAYEKRCFDVAPFNACCATCSSGNAEKTCTWKFVSDDEHNREIHGTFKFTGKSACCDALSDKLNDKLSFCPNGKVREACRSENRDIDVPDSWCQKQDLAHLECEWTYTYNSHSKGHQSLSGKLNGNFIAGSTTACNDACRIMGEKYNLPSAYCPGTRVMNIIEKCPSAKANFEAVMGAAKSDDGKPLKDAWCDAGKSVQWDSGRQSTEDDNYCPPEFAQMTFREFQCWNGTNSGGNGRKAFSQCCTNCLKARAVSQCKWRVEDQASGIKLDDSNTQFGEDTVECNRACTLIAEAQQAIDICPDKHNGNRYGGDAWQAQKGGKVWRAIVATGCKNAMDSIAYAIDAKCNPNSGSPLDFCAGARRSGDVSKCR